MKPLNTQHEVLFFTKTTFARKEFASKDEIVNKRDSLEDALEKAFWDGLLFEMLPELNNESDGEKKFLWQVNNYNSSLWMNMGNKPFVVDQHMSVDPHQFLGISLTN